VEIRGKRTKKRNGEENVCNNLFRGLKKTAKTLTTGGVKIAKIERKERLKSGKTRRKRETHRKSFTTAAI